MRYTTRIIVPPKVRRSGPAGVGSAHKPQVLGVRKTFGFDDPFGLASAGHLEAAGRHPDFAPFFVQYDFAAASGTGPTAAEAVSGLVRAASAARFRSPWGADANRLRTPQEVETAAAAGFTCYTLDPTEYVRSGVEDLPESQVESAVAALVEEGILTDDWAQPYLDRTIDLPGSERLVLTLEPLQRAAAKYGRAIRHCARLSEAVARANHGRPFEIEAFFADGSGLHTALEHLFIGLELEARGVRLTGLALKLVAYGDEENAPAAQVRLRQHVAMAEFCGPYKLSFHGLSFAPALCSLVGACCGEAFHVRSRGVSYLEALRVVSRTNPRLLDLILDLLPAGEPNAAADQRREWIAGAVAGDLPPEGTAFATAVHESAAVLFSPHLPGSVSTKDAVTATLDQYADIYREQLAAAFDKYLALLKAS